MIQEIDYNDEDFIRFLKELLDSNMYEQADDYDEMFEGIAKLAIDKGWDNLSERQQKVIKIRIEQICPNRCSHCLDSIPWCEMMFAIEHGGMCSHCVHVWGNLNEE